MENLADIYEEVLEFMENVKSFIDDIPDFEEKDYCEDYLSDIVKLCSDWLEQNQEEYLKIKTEEENSLIREYERSRLDYGILENKKTNF